MSSKNNKKQLKNQLMEKQFLFIKKIYLLKKTWMKIGEFIE